MEYILALIAVPVIWIIASKFIFPHNISNKEIGIQFGITIFFVGILYMVSTASLTSDVELLNGEITGKDSVRVSCSHSYDCHCKWVTRGTGKNKRRVKKCDTCYRHNFDVNWEVYSTVGNFQVSRVNSQGNIMPPRWNAVVVGEPASTEHAFTNYIKGAKLSMFNYKNEELDAKFAPLIPKYPQVYDYHRVKRVFAMGIDVPNVPQMNYVLNALLKKVGPEKQANIVVVIVNTLDQGYRYALERAWVGGKQNDIIVILGVTKYPTIDWVDTITIGKNSGNELLQVKMRDQLTALQSINNSAIIINEIAAVVQSDYKRKSMKDFEYLEKEIQPSQTALVVMFILTLLVNIGLSIFFYRERF